MGKFDFMIVLTQGLNRQIRRMCEYLEYEVTALKRVRIMNVQLDVPVGEWRYLTPEELQTINQMVATSEKTEPLTQVTKKHQQGPLKDPQNKQEKKFPRTSRRKS